LTALPFLLIFCCRYGISDLLYKKYNWWINELESLGINTLQKNGLNNQREASDSIEAVKQMLSEDYLQAYSESNR
jgi:hypothetical protein